jgi:tRNA pseudouridine38-40 synthase
MLFRQSDHALIRMSQRLKVLVAYDGNAFAGWQSQSHRKTIQDELERAFQKISGASIRVHGAGRTDAGVHALGQCAHVDLLEPSLSVERWPTALNAVLPPTIRVLKCSYVSQDFHARFSAKRKTYRYRIWAGPILPPLEIGRAWHIPARFEVNLLKAAGEKFVGRHDFTAFAAKGGQDEPDKVRTIFSLRVSRRGALVSVEITGDGFLYKMVRLIIGAMARVALNKLELSEIEARLKSKRATGARFVAPAHGLYLIKIWY